MTEQTPPIPLMVRVVGSTFGFAFAAIGLAVLGFLWLGEDGFGSPPLFFRIVGSLIAIVFVIFGGSMGLAAITAKVPPLSRMRRSSSPAHGAAGAFACPHCGAALASKTEASPHGDIKCPFCGAWFNIHGRTT